MVVTKRKLINNAVYSQTIRKSECVSFRFFFFLVNSANKYNWFFHSIYLYLIVV